MVVASELIYVGKANAYQDDCFLIILSERLHIVREPALYSFVLIPLSRNTDSCDMDRVTSTFAARMHKEE